MNSSAIFRPNDAFSAAVSAVSAYVGCATVVSRSYRLAARGRRAHLDVMAIPTVVREHKLVTALVLAIGVPIIAFALWTFIALHYTYSSGERAGFLQKISQRGWLCKTWEGDLQIAVIPGAAPEVFTFTTRSDSIAAELNKLTGRRVVLNYKQHKGLPGSCFGDTEYFVTGVRPVGAP